MSVSRQDQRPRLHSMKRKLSDATDEQQQQQRDTPRPDRIPLQIWSELPAWQQLDMGHVETGYRPESGSYTTCLNSWFYLHNETVNIFSHLIGSVLFLALPFLFVYYEMQPRYQIATQADKLVILVYLLGVAVCFALSATYHTIANHSEAVLNYGLQLDLQGVLLLMWSATVPITYYAFICEPYLQKRYWTAISSFAVACSILTFTPGFIRHGSTVRLVRVGLFAGLALAAITPIAHSLMKYGWEVTDDRISMKHIAGILLFNATGAAAYALKFPEHYYRVRFDIFGASHQIMHVTVLIAALVHVDGLTRDFDHRHSRSVGC